MFILVRIISLLLYCVFLARMRVAALIQWSLWSLPETHMQKGHQLLTAKWKYFHEISKFTDGEYTYEM